MAEQPARLRRDALGLVDVLFQGVTHIAPALSVVFILPEIAGKAGPAMPLSLALSAIVCSFIANTVAQFSRYAPTSGGYFTFVSLGLGPLVGLLATWSYLIYDVVGPAGAIGYLGHAAAGVLGDAVPWWVVPVVTALTIWVLTYLGIRVSTHTMAVLGAVEMLIMLALGASFLARPAAGSSLTAPLTVSAAPGGVAGVLAGMLFSILALTGFEAPAPLAQETRRPTRFIYLAIFASLALVGLFYVFMAYATAVGFGTGDMERFKGAEAYDDLVRSFWGRAGQWLVQLAVLNSALALGIACTNAASRVLYTMATAGTLPPALKKIHPVHKTPSVAIHCLQILQIASFLAAGFLLGPDQIFSCLGTITSLAVIVLYALANAALTVFVLREHPADFSLWKHGVVPAIGTLFLVPVTVITVWPVPEDVTRWMPYAYLLLMAVGVVAMIGLVPPSRRVPHGQSDEDRSELGGRPKEE
jgi:amino acid transporter